MNHGSKPIEIADIFRTYSQGYLGKYGAYMPVSQLKAMRAIKQCRTAALGGHIDECDECKHLRISYNSCRNRHCPKCQAIPTERWLRSRMSEVLPVSYFHIVFTVPPALNDILYGNQKTGYNIFFKSVSRTLQDITNNTDESPNRRVYLGARIGITSILHTWGQNLLYHPHIHCLVTGGGISHDKNKWIPLPRADYFIPVRVLSEVFKGKFLDYLQKGYGELVFNHRNSHLSNPENFREARAVRRRHKWVVYCKPPPENARTETLIRYFGRYTHRVAISNNRIIKLADGKVYFRYKDYRDQGRTKVMVVTAYEFIRRFLLHVLPDRLVKIRYYGFMSNANRKENIALCRELLQVKEDKNKKPDRKESAAELMYSLTGIDINICQRCKKGRMVEKKTLLPLRNNSPPLLRKNK